MQAWCFAPGCLRTTAPRGSVLPFGRFLHICSLWCLLGDETGACRGTRPGRLSAPAETGSICVSICLHVCSDICVLPQQFVGVCVLYCFGKGACALSRWVCASGLCVSDLFCLVYWCVCFGLLLSGWFVVQSTCHCLKTPNQLICFVLLYSGVVRSRPGRFSEHDYLIINILGDGSQETLPNIPS